MQPASHRDSHTRPDSAQTQHTTSIATKSAPCSCRRRRGQRRWRRSGVHGAVARARPHLTSLYPHAARRHRRDRHAAQFRAALCAYASHVSAPSYVFLYIYVSNMSKCLLRQLPCVYAIGRRMARGAVASVEIFRTACTANMSSTGEQAATSRRAVPTPRLSRRCMPAVGARHTAISQTATKPTTHPTPAVRATCSHGDCCSRKPLGHRSLAPAWRRCTAALRGSGTARPVRTSGACTAVACNIASAAAAAGCTNKLRACRPPVRVAAAAGCTNQLRACRPLCTWRLLLWAAVERRPSLLLRLLF